MLLILDIKQDSVLQNTESTRVLLSRCSFKDLVEIYFQAAIYEQDAVDITISSFTDMPEYVTESLWWVLSSFVTAMDNHIDYYLAGKTAGVSFREFKGNVLLLEYQNNRKSSGPDHFKYGRHRITVS